MNQQRAHFGNSRTQQKRAELRNNTGFAMEWTLEEQTILDNCLGSYPLDSNVALYARISLELPKKTTKDVAMRCRWMNGFRRVQAVESSNSAPQDAVTDELYKQNEQVFKKISENITSSVPSKLRENLPLFNQVRENIKKLVGKCYQNVPDQMKSMPPLPVTLNDDLFDFILQQIFESNMN